MPDASAGDFVDVSIRVRYAETDQMGYAYHSHYLIWFEVGRVEFCRAHGFTYAWLERETGTILPVMEAHCEYRKAILYDQEILVRTRLSAFRSRAMVFQYQVLDPAANTICAEGFTRHLVTDAQGRPKRFPGECLPFLARFYESTRTPAGAPNPEIEV